MNRVLFTVSLALIPFVPDQGSLHTISCLPSVKTFIRERFCRQELRQNLALFENIFQGTSESSTKVAVLSH